MPERASVFEAIQWAAEVTSGTAVQPNRQVLSMSVTPAFKLETNRFRPRGNKYNTLQVLGKDWTEAEVTGQPTYTEIIYPLSSILSAANVSASGSGYSWLFSPSSTAADSPKTFTIEAGSNDVRAARFSHGIFTSFGINYTRDNLELSGTILGKRQLEDRVRYLQITGTPTGGTFTITVGGNTTAGIDFDASASDVQTALTGLASVGAGNATVTGTGDLPGNVLTIVFAATVDLTTVSTSGASLTGGTSPASAITRLAPGATALDLIPVVPTQVSIYLDDTAAGLGTTKLLRVLNAEWNISGKYNPVWPIDAAQDSWAATVEAPPEVTLNLGMAADSQAMTLLNQIRSGDKRFVRILAEGDTYDTGHKYTLRVDQCVTIGEISAPEDEDGLVRVDLSMIGAHDATWGRSMQVLVKNEIAAL